METLVVMCYLLGYRYCKVNYKHEKALVKYFFKLFIFGCARPSLLQCSLSLVAGATLQLWCVDFSLRWLLLLWCADSRCVSFSSCSTQALQLHHAACRFQNVSSVAASCSMQMLECELSSCIPRTLLLHASGIFLNQASNSHSLNWQVDSYPLYYQGSPD